MKQTLIERYIRERAMLDFIPNPKGKDWNEIEAGARAIMTKEGNIYVDVSGEDMIHSIMLAGLIKAGIVKDVRDPYDLGEQLPEPVDHELLLRHGPPGLRAAGHVVRMGRSRLRDFPLRSRQGHDHPDHEQQLRRRVARDR